MKNKKFIAGLLKKKVLVLDGATGTELQKYGMPAGESPELWCLSNPKVLQAVHANYVRAGAQAVYTCTFGGNRIKLSQYAAPQVRKVNKGLAVLARKAVGDKVLVAGDIGPTGSFIDPFGPLGFDEAVEIYKEQARGLLEGGVDLFVIETMMDIQEARAALIAVKELTDKFVMVTMTYENSGRTLNGTDPLTALVILQSLGADAVGCNCSTGPTGMLKQIQAMKPYAKVPLAAKPNAGMPRLSADNTIFDMEAQVFASFGKDFIKAGAALLGGCCGTTPEHIKALSNAVRGMVPLEPACRSVSALASARKTIFIGGNKLPVIIGERINPTGKKDLQEELLKSKFSIIREMIKGQAQKGAEALDINIGVAGIDEDKTIKAIIELHATISDAPLVIDSSNIKTIESALRFYPGRALLNSISGEKQKVEKLLSLAAKYGAMFVLLPITGKEVPLTAEERKKIIAGIFKQAEKFGFTKDDIVVDAIAMSISSHPQAALVSLEVIEWCTRVFKCNTVVGLSNISFGMPARQWINAAYMAMAQAKGLSMAILNPSSEEVMNMKRAVGVLAQKDKNASMFIAHYAKSSSVSQESVDKKDLSDTQRVTQAILEGNKEQIDFFMSRVIKAGEPAVKIMNEVVIPAITEVGVLFDKKEYFLPQLIASAETTQKAFAHLAPYLKTAKADKIKKAVVILATVEGDIHDIGKNIVSLMLKNHGFSVIDLGKDVSTQAIIAAIKRHKPDVVGLSALMTTTMVNMREVIAFAKKAGLKCSFIVGGAAVTKSFAQSIGAQYGKDGVDAVRVIGKMKKP
ncbi:MAG: homocysteine S-methyltransferase family protein [Candidatus Omnitrophota bacterium]|jgi:5-methyltetrahydrofolate--homocysteine methyltransferase